MGLFIEAGVFSWIAFAALLSALARAASRPVEAERALVQGAVAVLALGALGASLGQRLVDRAVGAEGDLEQRVLLLSAGTRETTANLLLAGLFALGLLLAAAFKARARPRS